MQRDEPASGGGLFPFYPTSGAAIREAADDVGAGAGDISTVRRQVDAEHRRAMGAVTGDLLDPMTDAPAATRANMDRVAQAAQFAAGVLRLFADAVDDYNHYATSPRSVAALNAAYTDARLDDFGLDAGDYTKNGPKVDDDHDTDLRAADAALKRSLSAEYQRLGGWLDARADQVARMLDRGPNPGDVTALWAAGALPPDAYEVWSGLNLEQVPLVRLPYELREDPGDRRSLNQLSDDELMELWEEYGFEPAGELVGNHVASSFENSTPLNDAWLSLNPVYLDAITRGFPEDFARKLAHLYPATILDAYLSGPAAAGELGYALTSRDLIDAIRDDPWSLRTLAELAMVTPVGKVGKVRDLQRALELLDNARDAQRADSALQGARLREHLRQLQKYGEDGIRVLENGRIRYYGELDPATKPGVMLGRRMVREWDPATGVTRTWHETIDTSGTVRIVRPQSGPEKIHYHFDKYGNYGGRR